MSNGIQVPVSLYIENLQKIINDLKGQLGNLKVGSSGFKAMETHIHTLQKELDRFQIQASKPFLTQNQFTAAEKSVDRLEDEIERVSLTASRLKFSDLELNGEQKAQLQAVTDQINTIKASLKALKDEAKSSFAGSDLGKEWLNLHPGDVTKSLDQITNNIRRAVEDQSEQVKKAEEVVASYKRTITMGDIAQNVAKSTKGLGGGSTSANGLEALMGKEFSDFFTKHKDGTVAGFKGGQRGLFEEWLIKNFNIDSQTIHNLVSQSAPEIAKALNNAQSTIRQELNKSIVGANDAKTKLPGANLNVTQQNAELSKLTDYLNQAADANGQMKLSEEQLREALSAAGITLEKTQESITADVRAKEEWRQANSRGTAELENLRNALSQTNAEFLQQQRITQNFNSMKMAVVNFMGFRQVLNLTKNAVREAINHIKELDSVMNKISIVTDMSTEDLWQQVDAYSKMAQQYGTSIKGAYEVSQIYYQQGLQTKDVLTLTNETLKLARISGLDYATTTDYMTTALRGFKMEMSEASRVVDVYSNLASHTAVSQEELAVAMSKTASSMEGVGATFEEASAMIGTMVAVTRESATNIGSAMKSIASRYGELTKDPTKLVDEEGEAMAFNKVDAALQSVGISMRTVDGQFREFTDVIIELGEKWDQLESTQQRYIATQFAGNRQQSRFLALVSNVDLLKSNLNYAEDSEDTGTLQALKALDSIEAKIEQVRVAYQQFYTTLGAENVWKGLLDGAKNVINTLNSLPKLFGKIPLGAIAAVSNVVILIKNLLTRGIQGIASIWSSTLSKSGTEATKQGQNIGRNLMQSTEAQVKAGAPAVQAAINAALSLQQTNSNVVPLSKTQQTLFNIGNNNFKRSNSDWQELAKQYNEKGLMSDVELASASKAAAEGNENAYREAVERTNTAIRQQNGLLRENTSETNNNNNATKTSTATKASFFDKLKDGSSKLNRGLSSTAMALTLVGMVLDKSSAAGRTASGVFTTLGGALQTGTSAARVFAGDWSALPQLVMGVINIINGFDIAIESPAERLERLKTEAEELNNEAKKAKAEYRTLDNSIKKLDELKEKRYESTEAAEEYQTAVDDLAEKFPAMIAGFDEAGNIILDTTDAERILAEAREKSKQATYDAAKGELDAAKEARDQARKALKDMAVPSITANGDFDVIGQLQAQRGEILQQSLGTIIDPTKLDILKDAQKTLELFYQAAFDIDTKKLKTGYEFLENAKNPETKRLELTRLEEYFTSLRGNLSDEEREIYSALYSTVSPQEIAKRFAESASKLSELLSEGSSKDILDAYTELDGLLNLATKSQGFDEIQLNAARNTMAALSKQISTIVDLEDTYTGYEKAVISAWQQSSSANHQAWEILQNSSTAAAMVTKQIVQNITDKYDGDFDAAKRAGAEIDWEAYQTTMADFIKLLSPEDLELFNKITSDTNNYSPQDIIDRFNIKDGNIQQYIIDYYSDGIESIQTRLNSALAQSLGKSEDAEGKYQKLNAKDLKGRSEFYKKYFDIISKANETNLTVIDEQYLNLVLKQYDKLNSEGYHSRAENFGNAALALFNEVGKAPADIEKQIWKVINESGLSSLESIEKIKNIIKTSNANLASDQQINADSFIEILQSNIIPNINLEIQTATSNLLETWEDTSKELSSALSGGVSLKEADALIAKAKSLGLENFSLNNFQLVGDKLVLVGKSFDDYYQALTSSITTNVETWQTKIDDAKALLGKAATNNENLLSEQNRLIFAAVGITDITPYVDENGILIRLPENINALWDAINQNQESLDNYSLAAGIAARQILTAHETSQGIYKLTINTIETNLSEDLEKLKIIASGGSVGGNALDEAAIKKSINSVYDTLISDVLSKGFNNIHLTDYEGLVQGQDIVFTSYEQFVRDYIDFSGKTTDEINDLLLQAYEKDRETTSEDLIKDFTFLDKNTFRASRKSLTELANAYDIGIKELIDAGQIYFDDATQEYVMSVSDLAASTDIDLTQINHFKETVQESVDGLFSNLTSDIQNAVRGKLSTQGVTQLQETMAALNINSSLDFTKTEDGLKLTEDSFFTLYSQLKKTNSLTAKSLIPTIKDMTSEYGNLIDAQKEWKEALKEGNTEKAEALADVVGDYLRSSAEGYNLVDKDLPLEVQKAKNLYESFYKGDKAIQESQKSKTMEVEDFYSIFGQLDPSTIIGDRTVEEILASAQDGFQMLNDKMVVNLETLGITSEKDFEIWRQAWLDHGKKIQELGVIYEQTVNTLNKGSKSLDWTEVIDEKTGQVDKNKLQQKIKDNTDVRDALSQIIVNDTSLVEMLENGSDAIPQSLLDSLIKRFSSGDFTVEGLLDDAIEMLGVNADNIQLDVDEFTGQIKLNYQVDKNQIVPSITVGGQTLTGENYNIYKELMAQEKAQLTEGAEGFTIDFIMNDVGVTATYNVEDQKFTYDVPGFGRIESLEELKMALAVQTAQEAKNDSTEYEFSIGKFTYKINVDANGKIISGTKENSEGIQELVGEELEKIQQQYNKSNNIITTDVKTQANVNDLGLSVDANTDVHLNTEYVTLSKTLPRVTGNVEELELRAQTSKVNNMPSPAAIPETTQLVSKLIIALSGNNVDNQVEQVWNEFKEEDYTTTDKKAIVALLKIGLGNNNIEEDPEIQAGLEAYQIEPVEQKEALLSAVLLGLKNSESISLGEGTDKAFSTQASALLSALDVPVDVISLVIKGFKLINETIPSDVPEETRTELEASLSDALSQAALTGDIQLAQLIISGFTNGIILDPQMYNSDGSLNLPKLAEKVAKANIEKLTIIANNIDTEDIIQKSTKDGNGLMLEITGATAEVTGLKEIKLEQAEATVDGEKFKLTITDAEGNIQTIDIPAKIGEVDISDYFKDGEYIGSDDLKALINCLVNEQSWTDFVNDIASRKITTSVNVTDDALNNSDLYFAGRQRESWAGGYHSWIDKVDKNSETEQKEILDYVTKLSTLEKLNSTQLQNLKAITGTKEIEQATKDMAQSLLIAAENAQKDLKSEIETLKQISEIEVTNINTLTAALNGFYNIINLIANVKLDAFLENLNTIKESIASDENVNGWVANVKISPEAKEFDDKIAKATVTRTAKINVELGTDNLTKAIDDLIKTLEETREANISVTGTTGSLNSEATGNVAQAKGNTLMGELGPEIVVANGHYYVVGQNGAEFVDLPKDAIVFNHLQTQRLLSNGKTGRGKPITNEYVAAGMAHAADTPKDFGSNLWNTVATQFSTAVKNFSNIIKTAISNAFKPVETAAEKQVTAAEKQTDAAEALTESTENIKAIVETNNQKLHSKVVRRNGSSASATATSTYNAQNSLAGRYQKGYESLILGRNLEDFQYKSKAGTGTGTGAAAAADNKEVRSAVSSVISDLLSKGLEAIDLSDAAYDKLDATTRAAMSDFINQADASYREFINTYAGIANYTVREFNEKYFEAWQKDIENMGLSTEVRDAARNLSVYSSGRIGGSSEDWVTLFGEYTVAADLFEAGILSWNEDLEQYIVTSIEALQEYDTNLDIDELKSILADGRKATNKAMTDLVKNAESGEITYSDIDKLNAYLDESGLNQISQNAISNTANGLMVSYQTLADLYNEAVEKGLDDETINALRSIKDTRATNLTNAVKNGVGGSMSWEELDQLKNLLKEYDEDLSINFINTKNGLELTNTSAISLYNTLKKVDKVKAQLVFDELNTSLKETNDHYKTTLDITNRIADLQKKIAAANATRDETKIKQYKEELDLAKQILAIRTTSEDDSYNFMDQKIPGGMYNPLNYASSITKAMQAYREALTPEDKNAPAGYMGYEDFYNMASWLNDLAERSGSAIDFAGHRLTGSIESFSDLMTAASSNLVATEDGSVKVALTALGTDLETGFSSAATSAQAGLKEFAQAQVKVIDTLIKFFETIVALEGLEDVDINQNDKLDLTEIFVDATLGEYTQAMQDYAASLKTYLDANESLKAAFQEIKVNNTDLYTIMTDATDGVKNVDLTAEQFRAVVDGFFQMAMSDEWDPNAPAESVTKFLNAIDADGITIDYGDIHIETHAQIAFDVTEPDQLTTEQIQVLKEAGITTGEQLKKAWGESEESHEEFEVKYGFKLVCDEEEFFNQEGIDTLNKLLADEAKTVYITATLSKDSDSNVANLLNVTGDSTLSVPLSADSTSITEAVKKAQEEVDKMPINVQVNADTTKALDEVKSLVNQINEMTASIDINLISDEALTAIQNLNTELDKLGDKSINITVGDGGGAQAKGNAMAAGSKETLMGELGPELYVSNGRYYVAGQNGAEFVSLPNDAIVFNHLQTKKLLSSGATGRGKPVTNEANAVAMARGNTGYAAASARSILATLKQLKTMWESLANISISDLAGVAGSGAKNSTSFLADIERWYNLLQKIARLEKQINYEEALRNKISSDWAPNGKEYYESQVRSLVTLRQEAAAQKELSESQEAYFNQRIKELNERNSPLTKFYGFDERGQLMFNDGALAKLTSIFTADDYRNPLMTPKQQYDTLISYGLGAYMQRDSSGALIEMDNNNPDDFYSRSVQAAFDRMTAEQKEIQSLYDSKEDAKVKYLEAVQDMNEVLKEIRDNQMSLENQILDAIVYQRQLAIDNLTDERNALEDSINEYIDGLSNALSRERELYENQQTSDELTKLQRQLAILQRSGGSASQIASLQSQITSKQKDIYFNEQQDQIDAIQQASDLEIERLDQQIQLMTETLAYEKDNGLLWNQVYDYMTNASAQEIADFITANNAEMLAASPLGSTQTLQETIFSAEQWTSYRDDSNANYDALAAKVPDGQTVQAAVMAGSAEGLGPIFSTVAEDDYNEHWSGTVNRMNDSFLNDYATTGGTDAAAQTVSTELQNAASLLSGIISQLQGVIDGLLNMISDTMKINHQELLEALSALLNASIATITSYISGVTTAVNGVSSTITAAGNAIINAISGMSSAVSSAIAGITPTIVNNYSSPASNGDTDWITKGAQKLQQVADSESSNTANKAKFLIKQGLIVPEAATGAMVDQEGIAKIHNNEVILTAEQTKFLRNEILSNKPTSLLSLLTDFRDAYSGIPGASAYSSITNGGVTIANATVEMNVSKIANDYDAQRAGEQALEKMMQIARKTQGQNRIGR